MYRFLLAAIALAFSTAAQQTCYYPDGTVDVALTPCNTSAAVSACCRAPTDVCLSNGLCFATGVVVIMRRGCTDRTWNSTSCPRVCHDDIPYGPVALTPCDGIYKFCCGQDQAARACCNSANETMVIVNPVNNPVLENSTATLTETETATETATVTPNATSGANTIAAAEGNRECDKKTTKLAVGLGVPLFLAVVGFAIAATALYKGSKHPRGPVRAPGYGAGPTHRFSVGRVGNST